MADILFDTSRAYALIRVVISLLKPLVSVDSAERAFDISKLILVDNLFVVNILPFISIAIANMRSVSSLVKPVDKHFSHTLSHSNPTLIPL